MIHKIEKDNPVWPFVETLIDMAGIGDPVSHVNWDDVFREVEVIGTDHRVKYKLKVSARFTGRGSGAVLESTEYMEYGAGD